METNITQENIFSKLNSVSDIIQAMVDGVRKEWVKIDMNSFGMVKEKNILFDLITIKRTCYGCAATNTLCQLMGESFTPKEIGYREDRLIKINHGIRYNELYNFENAIDFLRCNQICSFIEELNKIKNSFSFEIPSIKEVEEIIEAHNIDLKVMYHKNLYQLRQYELLAEKLRDAGY